MPRVSSVLIELNRDGVRELLASEDVQRMLDQRAHRVVAAARGQGVTVDAGAGAEPLPVEAVSAGNAKRARALVSINHPAGLRVEAKHRVLGRALGAARGD